MKNNNKSEPKNGCIIEFIIVVCASFPLFVMEWYLAIPLSGVFYVVYGVLAGLILLPVALIRAGIVKTIIIWLFVAELFALYFVPWTSRKQFLNSAEKVKIGMSAIEVDKILGNYIKFGVGTDGLDSTENLIISDIDHGKYYRRKDEPAGICIIREVIYRHSDEARFNADLLSVKFNDYGVCEIKFMYD
jgi:hypothetical protein